MESLRTIATMYERPYLWLTDAEVILLFLCFRVAAPHANVYHPTHYVDT